MNEWGLPIQLSSSHMEANLEGLSEQEIIGECRNTFLRASLIPPSKHSLFAAGGEGQGEVRKTGLLEMPFK